MGRVCEMVLIRSDEICNNTSLTLTALRVDRNKGERQELMPECEAKSNSIASSSASRLMPHLARSVAHPGRG